MYKIRQLAKTGQLQLDITFLFINIFLIILFEGLTSTSGYKNVALTQLPHMIKSNVNVFEICRCRVVEPKLKF